MMNAICHILIAWLYFCGAISTLFVIALPETTAPSIWRKIAAVVLWPLFWMTVFVHGLADIVRTRNV